MWAKEGTDPSAKPREASFESVGVVEEIIEAAKKSRAKEQSLHSALRCAEEREASVREITSATPEDVQTWLGDIKDRRDAEDRRLFLNAEQYEMVARIAGRVVEELRAEADGNAEYGEPLRWCLHGGPGTGKSHVLKVVKEELFQGILKWDMGVNFEIGVAGGHGTAP